MSEIIGATATADPPMAVGVESSPAREGARLAAWLAVVWLAIILIAVFFARGCRSPTPTSRSTGLKEVAPFQSTDHLLGGDGNGRDMLVPHRSTAPGLDHDRGPGRDARLHHRRLPRPVAGYFRGRVGNAPGGLFDILLAIPPAGAGPRARRGPEGRARPTTVRVQALARR